MDAIEELKRALTQFIALCERVRPGQTDYEPLFEAVHNGEWEVVRGVIDKGTWFLMNEELKLEKKASRLILKEYLRRETTE